MALRNSLRIAPFFTLLLHISSLHTAQTFQPSSSLNHSNKHLSQSQYTRLFVDLHHDNPEMPFEQTAAGAGGALPKRTKHKNRKKMRSIKGSSLLEQKSGPISEDELAHHVFSMYTTGHGGLMKQAENKWRRHQANEDDSYDDDDQVALLKRLDRHPALVLNADYQPLSVLPLSIWSWQETIKAVFSGKVSVVDVYPGVNVRAVNVDVPLPSVIALTEYARQPSQRPAFTRRNVFLRDGYKCQYCYKSYMTKELSLDHVTPRCVGGTLHWENTVTSCRKCNGRKGSTLPSNLRQIGMRLLRQPSIPTKWELAANAEKMVPKRVHPTWRPFLGLNMLPDEYNTDAENESSSYFGGEEF